MNNIKLTGRLVRDPELKQTNGLSVCRFSIAVDRPFSKEKEVDFFDCVAFRQKAEFVNKFFMKGKPILVDGRMQSRKWVDKNNAIRVSWEVVVNDAEFFGGDKKDQSKPADIPSVPAGEFADLSGGDDDLPWKDDGLDELPL